MRASRIHEPFALKNIEAKIQESSVPNKQSAKKRARQNERLRVHNRAKRSDMRTAVKSAKKAILSKDVDHVDEQVKAAQAKLAKAAKTKLIKKNAMSRQQSRLMKHAHELKTASQGAEGSPEE